MILNYQEDMEVVATAADGMEAYTMVAKHRPNVLLMDLSMPRRKRADCNRQDQRANFRKRKF